MQESGSLDDKINKLVQEIKQGVEVEKEGIKKGKEKIERITKCMETAIRHLLAAAEEINNVMSEAQGIKNPDITDSDIASLHTDKRKDPLPSQGKVDTKRESVSLQKKERPDHWTGKPENKNKLISAAKKGWETRRNKGVSQSPKAKTVPHKLSRGTKRLNSVQVNDSTKKKPTWWGHDPKKKKMLEAFRERQSLRMVELHQKGVFKRHKHPKKEDQKRVS